MNKPNNVKPNSLARYTVAASLCLMTMAPAGAQEGNPVYSELWGKDGEKWSAASRLPDFSFAGYRSGEAPIPTPPVKVNVRDFGAKGDGEADDTQAFLKAIEAAENGAILVPAGRYKLTEIIYIRKPNIVLRGEGTDKTTLFFPKPLEQIKSNIGATTGGRPTSNYSWSGGLVWVQGTQTGAQLGNVARKANRGSNAIELDKPANVKPGQRVLIEQEDPGDKSLIHYLYQGQAGDISKITTARTSFVSKVTAVDGATITLERALRTDIDPLWKARARVFAPSVSEVGVENVTFEFPNTPYEGHFTEQGYNPLAFGGTSDCWARNLRIVNADSGPFLAGVFTTIENVVYETQRTPDKTGCTGHHGITLGSDNLFRNFDYRMRFIHDLTNTSGAGSVAMSGKGVDICFDHHKRFPHANLYTDIDLGAGTRMYRSGGGDALGRHTAAWTTFWNIRSARPQSWPPAAYGPDTLNLVGVQTKDAAQLSETGRWFEPITPTQLHPQNLYEAQLARRLKN